MDGVLLVAKNNKKALYTHTSHCDTQRKAQLQTKMIFAQSFPIWLKGKDSKETQKTKTTQSDQKATLPPPPPQIQQKTPKLYFSMAGLLVKP